MWENYPSTNSNSNYSQISSLLGEYSGSDADLYSKISTSHSNQICLECNEVVTNYQRHEMICPSKFMKCTSEANNDFHCLLCPVKILGEGSENEKHYIAGK